MVFLIAQTSVEMQSDHLRHKNHVVSSTSYNRKLCSKINEDNPIVSNKRYLIFQNQWHKNGELFEWENH